MAKNLICIISIILIFFFSEGKGQQISLDQVKDHYDEQATDQCVELFKSNDKSLKQIILIRHGEPDLDKKSCRNREAAKDYMQAYDTVGVIPFDPFPVCPEGLPIDKIYHSNLERAKHTAQLTFGGQYNLVEMPRFREFERKVISFFNIKMPLEFWMGFSRGLYMLGLNDNGIENFKEARKRARGNAEFLTEKAEQDEMVIVVAHGLHNKYVGKYLKKAGWELVRDGGQPYTAVNVYAMRMD